MKYEINKEIVFSTAHVTKTDLQMLGMDKETIGLIILPIVGGYGFRIQIIDDEISQLSYTKENLSSSFANLIDLAMVKGCEYLVLDRDGQIYDWLTQHDHD